jgi:hypothetical protein
MTTQLKNNNFSVEANKYKPNTIKPKIARPNIDHLIKRILVERRKEQKKNFLIFTFILLTISGSVILTF